MLEDGEEHRNIRAGGIIIGTKVITTKKGDKMSFVTLLTEKDEELEITVFPKLFNEKKSLLYEGSILAFLIKIDQEGRITADGILPLSEIDLLRDPKEKTRAIGGKPVALHLRCSKAEMDRLLKCIFKEEYKGRMPIYWYAKEGGNKAKLIKGYGARFDSLLNMKLERAVGKENIHWCK